MKNENDNNNNDIVVLMAVVVAQIVKVIEIPVCTETFIWCGYTRVERTSLLFTFWDNNMFTVHIPTTNE